MRLFLTAILMLALSASATRAETPAMRVASVQMEVTDDWRVNLPRILKGISDAKAAGARVALFPETALSGYNARAIEHPNFDDLDGAMKTIAEATHRAGLYVLYGCATRSGTEKPFNSVMVLDPKGDEITRYHKMFPGDRFTGGDHLALFNIDDVPCTLMICHDERFPELTRIPVLAGAKLCFYLSYELNGLDNARRKKDGYRAQTIARAVENGVWLAQCNGVGPLAPSATEVSLGNSQIIAPDGVVVASAPEMAESLLVADLQPDEAKRGNPLETWENPALKAWWRAGIALLETPRAQAKAERDKARLALMRGVPTKWDLDANFKMFLQQVKRAGHEHADIFITPECWIDGYAAPDHGSTPDRLREVAQDLNSSAYLKQVSEQAKKHKLWICFGFTSLEDGKIYNAAGLWDDTGKLIGVYRKTHLQTHDLQFSPGDALPVWPSPWGPLGIMICADRRWPETARTLRLQGARLILNPTYGMHGENNEAMMRTRSYENECFIAFAHPELGLITNPKGDVEKKDKGSNPDLTICDVDLSRATMNKHLEDRRPDIYSTLLLPAK